MQDSDIRSPRIPNPSPTSQATLCPLLHPFPPHPSLHPCLWKWYFEIPYGQAGLLSCTILSCFEDGGQVRVQEWQMSTFEGILPLRHKPFISPLVSGQIAESTWSLVLCGCRLDHSAWLWCCAVTLTQCLKVAEERWASARLMDRRLWVPFLE